MDYWKNNKIKWFIEYLVFLCTHNSNYKSDAEIHMKYTPGVN